MNLLNQSRPSDQEIKAFISVFDRLERFEAEQRNIRGYGAIGTNELDVLRPKVQRVYQWMSELIREQMPKVDYKGIYMMTVHEYYKDQGLPHESPYLGVCQDNISHGFCRGSGYYSFKDRMICFRCAGKGTQDEDDVIRNRFYDYFNRNQSTKVINAMKEVKKVWDEMGIEKAYQFQSLLDEQLHIKIDLITEDMIKQIPEVR